MGIKITTATTLATMFCGASFVHAIITAKAITSATAYVSITLSSPMAYHSIATGIKLNM